MNDTFVSNGKIHHNRTVQERNEEIEATILTDEEQKYALWIGKTNKWYKERRGENDSFKAGGNDLKNS